MPRLRLWRFVLRFAALYGLLMLPWPGVHPAIGAYIQAFGNLLFGRTGHQVVQFRAKRPTDTSYSDAADTMMLLYNYDIVDKNKRAGWLIGLDTRQLFWLPFAFYVALTGATPMPWRRRVRALLLGVLAAHVLMALKLTLDFADRASTISMIALSPFWQSVVARLSILLIAASGPSILVYLFIWPFASFRREDLVRLVSGGRDHAPTRQEHRAQLRATHKLQRRSERAGEADRERQKAAAKFR